MECAAESTQTRLVCTREHRKRPRPSPPTPSSVPSGVLSTLVQAIASGQRGIDAWVGKLRDELQQELAQATPPSVVVGATGGLRKALDAGEVTPGGVDAFRVTLGRCFGKGRAQLVELSGEQEALLELLAVRYLATHCLPELRPSFGSGAPRPIHGDEVGCLSCGGMSSQLSFYPHLQSRENGTPRPIAEIRDGHQQPQSTAAPSPPLTPPAPTGDDGTAATRYRVRGGAAAFRSLRTNLLGSMALGKEHGLLPTLAVTEDRVWEHVASAGKPIGKLRGAYMAIELAGSIGKEAGLGHRLVSKRESTQLLVQHLESMQRMARVLRRAGPR